MRLSVFALVCLFLTACATREKGRERISFNKEWRFALTEKQANASAPDTDDSNWRVLNLPHDWSIEADFSLDNPATPGGGALPGGMGWYRKHFKLPESDKGKVIYIDFDGVYRNSRVWLNGHLLGFRPNGYVSFRYDLTPYLNYGKEENVLVVQADNSDQPNSRWYSGSGIYRNVWLVKTGQVHVDNWGTNITTPVMNADKSTVEIETTLKNEASDVTVEVSTLIQDKEGKTLYRISSPAEIAAGGKKTVTHTIEMFYPELWSVRNPYLYTAITEVRVGNKLTDRYRTTFGIRKFDWDEHTGFSLNGEPTKILGVCLHHDLGCLGSAVNPRALERQLQMMKDMGANAVRTSHNPPAPELLDICDRIGLLVQDEAFDMWRKRKSPYDYARYFDEWHEKDLTDQILRDRNHPSLLIWTPTNEEFWPDRVQYPRLMHDLYNLTKMIDPTRPFHGASGGTHIATDIWTVHNYEQDPAKLKEKLYNGGKLMEAPKWEIHLMPMNIGYNGLKYTDQYAFPEYKKDMPYLVDEFGGIKWNPSQQMESAQNTSWGYGEPPRSLEEFYARLEGQVDAVLSLSNDIWGYCYTQLTDVEQEQNGIYYYDRTPKFDMKRIHTIFSKTPESK